MESALHVVAHEFKMAGEVDRCGLQTLAPGSAHLQAQGEAYHVVFALQLCADEAARVEIGHSLAINQLRVVHAWTEFDASPRVVLVADLVAVETGIGRVERREDVAPKDGLAIELRRKIFHGRRQARLLAAHGGVGEPSAALDGLRPRENAVDVFA